MPVTAYDHSLRAGNKGDVWKHFVLTSVIARMAQGQVRFDYLESHAGAPVHRLRPEGQWTRGVGEALGPLHNRGGGYVRTISRFLESGTYPSSWVLVGELLQSMDVQPRMRLFDTAPNVRANLSRWNARRPAWASDIRFSRKDGFEALHDGAITDLVFLDPPYSPNARADWRRLERACRFLGESGVSFLAWYPVYWPTRPDELLAAHCHAVQTRWTGFGRRPSQNMKGCGVLYSASLRAVVEGLSDEFSAAASDLGWSYEPLSSESPPTWGPI